MKAIIPVAGLGRRLRPHTHTRPKVLLSLAGKPILGHILDGLKGLGVDELILVIGHLGEQIEAWVREKYEVPAQFIRQGERLGLGHAVYLARERVKGEPVWIVYGDTICEADPPKGLDSSQDGCLGVKEVEDPRRFGIVELGEGGKVTRLVEKPDRPGSRLAIVGLNFIKNTPLLFTCLETIVREGRRTRGEFQLTDAFQLMVDRGATLTTFGVEGWFDCGKPEALLETNRHLLGKSKAQFDVPGSTVVPPVWIDPTATILNSVVGPWVSIGRGAVIRNCIVENTIIGEASSLEGLLLRDSLIGENAVLRGRFSKLSVGDSSEIEVSDRSMEERSGS